MALITNIIQPRNYELIRDRIGLILAEEIQNQFALTANQDINSTVYVERIVPFDKTEMPCLNVLLSRGGFGNNDVKQSDGTYTYFIDVYAKSKSTNGSNGDKLAMISLQKNIGIIIAILEDTRYIRLGFTHPSISSTMVSDFAIADPSNNQDASSIVMGRITFTVRVPEKVELINASDIDGWETSVTLEESDKGYVFTKYP